MKTLLLKAAKHLIKKYGTKKMKEKMDGGTGKIIMYVLATLMAIMFVLYIIYSAIVSEINSVVCRGMFENVLDNCPRPNVDAEQTYDIAEKMHKKRDEAMKGAAGGVAFRGELAKPDEQNPKYSEAQLVLLIVEQLDEEIRGRVGYNDKAYSPNGSKKDTNYGKTLKVAKSGEKWQPNWTTNKKLAHYFMAERANAWECFFVGDNCGNDLIGKEDRGIVSQKEGGAMKYATIREMLEKYYDYSLYNGLENGEERFNERLNTLIEEQLFNAYPEQAAGAFDLFSSGWILPMQPGSYNFSGIGGDQDFGPRNIGGGASTYHQGVDFGVSGQAGVPFYAMAAGTVMGIGEGPKSGATIVIDHHNGYFSHYQHMQREGVIVKAGQQVAQAQMLGVASDKGVGGIHLHWEMCKATYDTYGFDYERPGKGSVRCTDHVNPFADATLGLTPDKTPQTPAIQQSAVAYYTKNKARALAGEIVLMPGYVPGASGLGQISGKYESSGDPGLCVHNASDAGGLSCGKYQIAKNPGTLLTFMNFANKNFPEYKEFLGSFTSQGSMTLQTVGPKWRAASDKNKEGFTNVQHEFIKASHFTPQANRIMSAFGYNTTKQPQAMQEMIWSFSVQHNNNTMLAWRAAVGDKWRTMTNAQIVTAMYDYRYAKWSCCRPRFLQEKQDVLKMLGEQGKEKPVQ